MDTGLRIFRSTLGIGPCYRKSPASKIDAGLFRWGAVQPQVVMGDAAPKSKENLQTVRIRRDTFLKGKAAFVLDVVLDVAFGKIRRMAPEIDEAVYGGGVLRGCLRVFRGFAGGLEHSFHHGKDGIAVVGLAHVF